MIHIGFFELMVMFFGITNSPVTFQIIINKILRDIINKGNVMAFMDDMLVETEIEKEYDEIVEEILKRLKENDLYIKPKNYVWKVRSDS